MTEFKYNTGNGSEMKRVTSRASPTALRYLVFTLVLAACIFVTPALPTKRTASASPERLRPSKRLVTSSPEEGKLDDAVAQPSYDNKGLPTSVMSKTATSNSKYESKVAFPFRRKQDVPPSVPSSSLQPRDEVTTKGRRILNSGPKTMIPAMDTQRIVDRAVATPHTIDPPTPTLAKDVVVGSGVPPTVKSLSQLSQGEHDAESTTRISQIEHLSTNSFIHNVVGFLCLVTDLLPIAS